MTRLQKWDYADHEYKPYLIPDNWRVSVFEFDMVTTINCAGCGKEIFFGDGYTSRTIHTGMGFGYCVCEECYEKEWEAERKAVKRDGDDG